MNVFRDLEVDVPGLLAGLEAAGYRSSDARALHAGGLRALPIAVLESPEWRAFRSGAEFGVVSPFANAKLLSAEPLSDHLVCDRYYRRAYPSWPLEDVAIYGRDGIGYSPPDVDLPSATPLRVHDRNIPTFIAHSIDDIHRLVKATTSGNTRLFFRGQTKLHVLQRPPIVRRYLFGDADSCREPSLLTSAERVGVDGDELLGLMHLELQTILYDCAEFWRDTRAGALAMTSQLALPHELAAAPTRHADYWSHFGSGAIPRQVLALAQHYEFPTNGLDLTDGVDVALWFATNARSDLADGKTHYARVAWVSPDAEEWPCFFIFSAQQREAECFVVPSFAQSALRPARQQAYVTFGGWGWHSNIAAEDLRAVAYLAPTVADDVDVTADYLFPGPEEDQFYKALLARATRAISDDTAVARRLYRHIRVHAS